ncbi:uncharacterized protein LOC113214146 isoform X2 [Frankliniella occidentalis]|uniref:Uncharacterized protein LOC113214146 isoform X2 n=1 Tax=Frankliniella occidentalis TaxID=133901 RepID=A0A9C6U0Y5_FRAOC|nr:uncharacterized protein LOC113214146 isoform X2 [Frankliniella occidentalis]
MGRKASKPKVTFDETTTKRRHDGGSPPVLDDGDYALLQELPLVASKVTAPGSSVSDRSEASSSGGDSSGCATITGSPPGAHRSDHSSHSDTSGVHSSSSHSNASHLKLYEQLKYDPVQLQLLQQQQQAQQQAQQQQQQQQQARRANSIQDLCLEPNRPPPPQYKSFSLTRGMAPPGATAGLPVAPPAPLPSVLKLQTQPIYSSIRKPSQGVTLKPPQPALADEDESPPPPAPADPMRVPHHKPMQALQPVREELTPEAGAGGGGVPATLQLNGHDATVVIRRHKQAAAKEGEEDKFGRATNMRMTSFTDQPDHGRGSLGAGSAYGYAGYGYGMGSANTLPLPPPPPPPPAAQPHCATLPAHGAGAGALMQQHQLQQHQQQQQHQLASSCGNFVRQHSTIPTHHNGVLLYQPGGQGGQGGQGQQLQAMRLQQPSSALGVAYFKDHSMSPALKYGLQQHLQQHLRAGVGAAPEFQNGGRDSANFSMASSGDGEYAH